MRIDLFLIFCPLFNQKEQVVAVVESGSGMNKKQK